MKGSKNDYATFTGAIPASGSWQPGKTNLVGLVLGILLAWISKPAAEAVGLLGTLFVGALKAVAPILVLMLVMASIANHQHGQKTNIRPILFLYLLGTFSAALAAVIFSFAFPSTLHLSSSAGDISPPSGIVEVMRGLVMSMVSNPIDALLKGNYIGIWCGQLASVSHCVTVTRPPKTWSTICRMPSPLW